MHIAICFIPLNAAEHLKLKQDQSKRCLRVNNAKHRPSSRSACFSLKAQGIGIGNSNKFSSVFFFGAFLLDKQKKGTRLSCEARTC